ncbi:MAG: DUF177 domain-containing protein [Bradyrhizobiaceae bacterium]|nr:MAG: DUF177 domain-containing protein [Bradyrhizobiaceae bacterium]
MSEKDSNIPRAAAPGAKALPWTHPVMVSKIPQDGAHVAFEADGEQREGLARLAGLRDVVEASAEFDLTHVAGGGIHATGLVRGLVGQTCVVTLEPVDNAIEEVVDVVFLPEGHGAFAQAARPPDEEDGDAPDPPEPIRNGVIDLGKLAMDLLFLGIDPYPRKPGAVFEPPVVERDVDEHPFAALKALKETPPSGGKS